MITGPTVLAADATVEAVREFFADDHKHAALLVDHGLKLVAVVERRDLGERSTSAPTTPARSLGLLALRTVRPDADATIMMKTMSISGQRRLAVTDEHGTLVGLLCLKRTGVGFCSDADVQARARSRTGRKRTT